MKLTMQITQLFCNHNIPITECAVCTEEMRLGHEVPARSVVVENKPVETTVQQDGPGWLTLDQRGER